MKTNPLLIFAAIASVINSSPVAQAPGLDGRQVCRTNAGVGYCVAGLEVCFGRRLYR